jgi:mRNA-degrading endonuclease RelE of RelBE toxin-antitoxin system
MNVETKTSLFDDIESFPIKVQDKIIDKLDELETFKSLTEASNLRKMAGSENRYRMKVGNYRILLLWDKENQRLIAVAAVHRQGAYKKFKTI